MNKKLMALAVAAGMGFAGLASADDGLVGVGAAAQSVGTLGVQVEIPDRIQILLPETSLDFGVYVEDLDFLTTLSADACVRSSTPTYSLEITSTNNFALTSATDSIDYEVSWGASNLTSQTGLARDNTAGFGACDPAVDGVGRVSVALTGDLDLADAGVYTDTISLTVAPE